MLKRWLKQLGRSALLRNVLVVLAEWYMRFVWITSRWDIVGQAPLQEAWRHNKPVLIYSWHERLLMITGLWQTPNPLAVIASSHHDGLILSSFLKRFGLITVLGSTGKKGGRALRDLIRLIHQGISVAITPDGPRGPRHRLQPGIVGLARIAQVPMIPVTWTAQRVLKLKTWDRLMIPLPFNRGIIALGEPLWMARDTPDSLSIPQAEKALTTLTQETDQRWASQHPYPRSSQSLRAFVYQALWWCIQPGLDLLLKHRLRQGKEDPQRLKERYGHTSAPPFETSPLWIHGASVGEINAGLSLAHWIRAHRPDLPLLLTTTTRTGADYARRRLPERSTHQYIPLDHALYVSNFLKTWHPRAALFLESEFWPHILAALQHQNIPCLSIDSHLSKRSYRRWQGAKHLVPPVFPLLTRIYVSSTPQKEIFQKLGAHDVRSMPSLKWLNEPLSCPEDEHHKWRQALKNRWVWLAASTHEGEEEWVVKVYQALKKHKPDALLIWAPRHMARLSSIQDLLQKDHLQARLLSQYPFPNSDTDCMLIDGFGHLGLFYRLCPAAFIGGSLVPGIGGHNIIEPLQVGCLPLHGPHMDHAPHVAETCRQEGLSVLVQDPQQASAFLKNFYEAPSKQVQAHHQALTFCQHQREAVDTSLKTMLDLF